MADTNYNQKELPLMSFSELKGNTYLYHINNVAINGHRQMLKNSYTT